LYRLNRIHHSKVNMVKDWKGSMYPTGLGLEGIPIPDGAALERSLGLSVPADAPPGDYTLMVFVGYTMWESCNSFGLPLPLPVKLAVMVDQ
jgi:hypothetical protein